MSEENQPLKPDVVSSIFDRTTKKRISSLFTAKQKTPPLNLAPKKYAADRKLIKRVFPMGLDIGISSIKIVQLGQDQSGAIRIMNFINEELPKEIQDKPKERDRMLAPILKKIVSGNALDAACFVALPYNLVKFDLINLPRMPSSEIDKAVRWEIKQNTQAEFGEISFDYIALIKQEFFNNQTGILTVTASKKDISGYLAFLQSANLRPVAIDIEPLAELAALDYAGKLSPQETVLMLHMGASQTLLSIICNQELISIRQLNVTGNLLTKSISEYCRIPWEEAEAVKKTFGIAASFEKEAKGKAVEYKNAILSSLEDMVQDIEHTFKYFSYQLTRSKVTRFDRVILSAGASGLNYLVPFLSSRLNVDVRIADVFGAFEFPEGKNFANPEGSLTPRMNVALGLALRGIE
jgi:type IV pilus assembly protein PilM